jgi:hypothetical protein
MGDKKGAWVAITATYWAATDGSIRLVKLSIVKFIFIQIHIIVITIKESGSSNRTF